MTNLETLPADLQQRRVLDTRAAREFTGGLSDRQWRRMKKAGKTPPSIPIGERKLGYRIADLEAWLTARQAGQTA